MAMKADKDVNAVAGVWTRVVEIGVDTVVLHTGVPDWEAEEASCPTEFVLPKSSYGLKFDGELPIEVGDWLELLVEVVGTRGWLNHD